MTTVGHRGRPQLRAHQPEARRPQRRAQRSQKEHRTRDPRRAEADPRHRARVRLRPAGLGQPARARSGTLTTLINEFAAKVAKVPGIADLETSEKAANPALSIRLNNDAAADLGINVQQVGATVRPLLAGDTVSYWLGPDGQNYEVNVQLPKDRPPARLRSRQSLLQTQQARTRRRAADGAAAPGRRHRRDDEPADHQAPGAAAARRALRQRRGPAVRRRQHRRRRRSSRNDRRCRPATASTSAARPRTCRSRSRRRSRRWASR